VLEFESLETMIREINSRPKPLSLYLFTASKVVGKKIIDNISYGNGCINDAFIQVGNPYLPFGGVGLRESALITAGGALRLFRTRKAS